MRRWILLLIWGLIIAFILYLYFSRLIFFSIFFNIKAPVLPMLILLLVEQQGVNLRRGQHCVASLQLD